MNPVRSLVTTSLLHALKTRPNLPAHTWYFTAAVTLSALNLPQEITHVYHAALADAGPLPAASTPSSEIRRSATHVEHFAISRRMREALTKSTAIVGLPRTINSLLALHRNTPSPLLDPPMQPSPTSRAIELNTSPPSTILHRGSQFFANTYGKVAARVMGQMDRCGTEDLGLTARMMYGYLLSNESVLAKKETSFCLIAGLVPQDVNPQLKGHLKGALNNGASIDEVRAVRDLTVEICQAAGMRRLRDGERGSLGWTEDVANV